MTTECADLLNEVDALYELPASALAESASAPETFARFLALLERGEVRAASRTPSGRWKANKSVKRGILIGFRLGVNAVVEGDSPLPFADKSTFPVLRPAFEERNIRIVPGGSSIRAGAYIGRDVTCMPPMYVNVGAYVAQGTMIDSHALVGSCAQIGRRVHLSAGVQIGGVLEPIGQVPVVVEDDVIVGGNSGIYEGTIVRQGAVVGTGTILNASTKVYDLVKGEILRASPEAPLEIPAGAVVVPGSRPASGAFAEGNGIHLYTPVIVKYKDTATEGRTALEEALR